MERFACVERLSWLFLQVPEFSAKVEDAIFIPFDVGLFGSPRSLPPRRDAEQSGQTASERIGLFLPPCPSGFQRSVRKMEQRLSIAVTKGTLDHLNKFSDQDAGENTLRIVHATPPNFLSMLTSIVLLHSKVLDVATGQNNLSSLPCGQQLNAYS